MAVVEALILPKKSAIAICATPGLPLPPRRATLRALFSKKTQRAMSEIPKTYEPPAIEAKWYAFWEQNGCFAADPASPKPAYSIVIPPPNVTGVLTLGHVLNNTIQDILARRARMTGHEVLWLPGTDHAGIATQNVVEKTLRKEGVMKHRDDLGREALVGKIWEWKEKYGGIILKQLRALGASCDWSRTRFTMDEDYSRCVSRVFVDLYKKGLIYRGKRMVNWCPASLTALSDEEVIMKEQKGFMYHFRVEVVEEPGTFLTIATTRPETIPADTAVAVNPNDPRYTHLIGKHVYRALPLEVPKEQRRIPIIADDHVTFDFGTGVLKVTPAHDKADFEIGLRHKLPVIDVLTPDGRMTAEAGADLAGLDRFAARKKAHEILEAAGALEKAEPYVNNVGFSERADVPIEPRLSEQWFLKYPSVEQARACVVQPNESTKDTGSAGAPPAVPGASPGTSDVGRRPSHDSPATGNPTTPDASGEAPDAAGGAPALPSANARMRFFPDRWAKVYDHWLSGIQDWCISRQLWWGHRVPVWSGLMHTSGPELYETLFSRVALEVLSGTLPEALVETVIEIDGHKFSCTAENLKAQCDALGANRADHRVKVCTTNENFGNRFTSVGLDHDPDVLDTWFSSWLWPFATMAWPEKTDALAKFYPTTDLVTGPDIIFFWVARMIMAGFEWMGELPFKNVYFTGIIRDKQGRKMSKSLGNSPDPLDLISKYGADALRFGVMRAAPIGQDILFDEQAVELGRNFCNKLWNACRFRQMQGGETEGEIAPALLTSDDKWILLRLDQAITEVTAAFAGYKFSDATATLYRFFWSEYCDWYVEASKAVFFGSDAARKANTLAVIDFVLGHTLRLFHPFLPFITEELWNGMGFATDMPLEQGGKTIMTARWPKPLGDEFKSNYGLDVTDEQFVATKHEFVTLGRNLKTQFNLSSKRVAFLFRPEGTLPPHELEVLRLLLGAEKIDCITDAPDKGTPAVRNALGELFLPLEGVVDMTAERTRLGKELEKIAAEIEKVQAKLANPGFTEKVPAAVLAEHQTRLADWQSKRDRLQTALGNLVS